jgi:multidrug transporter EmrE-like cation transporter
MKNKRSSHRARRDWRRQPTARQFGGSAASRVRPRRPVKLPAARADHSAVSSARAVPPVRPAYQFQQDPAEGGHALRQARTSAMLEQAIVTASPEQKRRSLLLVFCCTLFGAAGQILIKSGANTMSTHPSVVEMIVHILTTPSLFIGYCFYGISTVLLVLALKHGELSLLYPVIALTFVWVTVLSVMIFHDSMNPLKLAGILIIMSGVAVLGRGSRG